VALLPRAKKQVRLFTLVIAPHQNNAILKTLLFFTVKNRSI
jgi:hypothetical protein